MKIGKHELDREDISVGLMILFALILMFFLGYQFAYSKAVTYANKEIAKQVEDYKQQYGIVENNFDVYGKEIPLLEDLENG
jgi:hypothetical protein